MRLIDPAARLSGFYWGRPTMLVGRVALCAIAAVWIVLPLQSRSARAQDTFDAVMSAQSVEALRAEIDRRTLSRTFPARAASLSAPASASPLASIPLSKLIENARKFDRGRVIYGVDDRKDYFEITDPAVRKLADATVALIRLTNFEPLMMGVSSIKSTSLKSSFRLCDGEKFEQQPTASFCSGTLIGPDLILTAGHCVREISNTTNVPALADMRFVFGYRVLDDGKATETSPESKVYAGREIVGGELEGDRGRDWAVIRLDRPVDPSIATPVNNHMRNVIAMDRPVFVIGYPSGLPLKYAPGANVRDISDPRFFVANLDTYGGNSGSGVFDGETNALVGILVRGETDYVRDEAGNCTRSNVCPTTGCRGEDVTRLSVVPMP